METEVIMSRELWGMEIRQKSKTEYFCASDLVNAGNKWRISQGKKIFNYTQWLKNPSTKEFIKVLENDIKEKVIIKGKQKNSLSWIHPFLFIDLALAISPELKLEAYKWLYDSLLKYRNQSGDSYKKMCGALYLTQSNKSVFANDMKELANKIKKECNVNDWEHATEEQLQLRDRIQNNIALLSDILQDRENLYAVAIKKAKENK